MLLSPFFSPWKLDFQLYFQPPKNRLSSEIMSSGFVFCNHQKCHSNSLKANHIMGKGGRHQGWVNSGLYRGQVRQANASAYIVVCEPRWG
jgi:hypothetical protein